MAELGVDLSDIQYPDVFWLKMEAEVCQAYHAYYTEIIDRMETRIVNLTGEREYLIDEYIGCEECTYGADAEFCEEPCVSCENMEYFEWSVPEDWRPDDD